jgi:hypothetical protein
MTDVSTQVSNAATAPISFAKRNPIGFALLMVVGVLVLLHFSGAINRWIAGRAASAPSGVWVKVGRWTGAVAAVVCMGLLLRDAASAYHAHGLLTMGTGLLSMASMFAFPAPDFVALKDENGNYTSTLTPGAGILERKFLLSAPRETLNGFPLKVTDLDISATFSMDNSAASSGGMVFWDDMFRIIAGLEIVSPRFGTICDKNAYTGPVAKHFGEYIGNGFRYSGDEAFATVSAAAGNYVVTLHVSYPIMARYLAKPEESAMFAGWMQQTQIKFNLAAATAIGGGTPGATIAGHDVTLRAGYRQFQSVGHGDPAAQYTVPPLVYRRTLLTPANGQFDVVFPQVSATGPQNTNVANGERLVAAVLLSDNLGLPGPGTFEAVTEMGCQGLGMLNTYNPDQWIKAKIPTTRQTSTMTLDGGFNAAHGRSGWPYTTKTFGGTTFGEILTAKLLGIPFALPGTAQKISKLPRVKGDLSVHVLQPTPPSGNGKQYAMYLETLRDIDGKYAAQLLAQAGVRAPVTRHVNHDADSAVRSGKVRAGQYTGMPQGPKT